MQIELNIDRVILKGIDLTPSSRAALAGILSAELGRLLEEGQVETLKPAGHFKRLQAEPIHLNGSGDLHELGSRLAAAIYGGLQGGSG